MLNIDLNCDIGEGFTSSAADMQKDSTLMDYVSSINIACGYHAGDACVMQKMVKMAVEKNIAIGAHPSFPDREDFGREVMHLPAEELYAHMIYQLGAIEGFIKVGGGKLHHVKPHGALYNLAAMDRETAEVICRAFADFDKSLIVFALSGSEMIKVAEEMGLQTANEVFADRTYQADGTLTPRKKKDALIDDDEVAVQQVLGLIRDGKVRTTEGEEINLEADTVCIHGDGNHAIIFAHRISKLLKEQGVQINALSKKQD
jgi:5-oxoprolinase (ATP-hydrolysing) subunit A